MAANSKEPKARSRSSAIPQSLSASDVPTDQCLKTNQATLIALLKNFTFHLSHQQFTLPSKNALSLTQTVIRSSVHTTKYRLTIRLPCKNKTWTISKQIYVNPTRMGQITLLVYTRINTYPLDPLSGDRAFGTAGSLLTALVHQFPSYMNTNMGNWESQVREA